jgi:hypothetical protein
MQRQLENFSSIVCFQAAICGNREALGEKPTVITLTTAGCARGKKARCI